MTDYTLSEALGILETMEDLTLDDLKDLVSQMKVTKEGTQTTVFYSGDITVDGNNNLWRLAA